MNCQFMFCFHVKTRDFEREGRFFDGGRKLFGTTFTVYCSSSTQSTTQQQVFLLRDYKQFLEQCIDAVCLNHIQAKRLFIEDK